MFVQGDAGRLLERRRRVADHDIGWLIAARAVAGKVGHVHDVVERQSLHAAREVDFRPSVIGLASDWLHGLCERETVKNDRMNAALGDQAVEKDLARAGIDDRSRGGCPPCPVT